MKPNNDGFAEFWERFPGRITDNGKITKGSRAEAELVWLRIPEHERKLAMLAMDFITKPQRFLPDCRRWLKGKFWEGINMEITPPKKIVATIVKPVIEATPEQKAATRQKFEELKRRTGNALAIDYKRPSMNRERNKQLDALEKAK